MALNAARQGHVYPAYRYEVCREKVIEYAEATFADPAPYALPAEDAAPAPAAPPAFAACIVSRVVPMVVDDPELGGHWNLLHTGQRFRFDRPLHIGDTVVCTPRIDKIVSRSRMDVLTVTVDVASAADGAPVLAATATIVFSAAPQGS